MDRFLLKLQTLDETIRLALPELEEIVKLELTESNLFLIAVVQETVRQVFEHRGEIGSLRWLHIKDSGRGLFGPLSERHREIEGEANCDDVTYRKVNGQIYFILNPEDEKESSSPYSIGAKIVCHGWEWTVNACYDRKCLVVNVEAGEGCSHEPLTSQIARKRVEAM